MADALTSTSPASQQAGGGFTDFLTGVTSGVLGFLASRESRKEAEVLAAVPVASQPGAQTYDPKSAAPAAGPPPMPAQPGASPLANVPAWAWGAGAVLALGLVVVLAKK